MHGADIWPSHLLGLLGILLATIAFLFGSWILLKHAGRDVTDNKHEPDATDTWLSALDLVIKGEKGAGLFLLTVKWFAVISVQQNQVRIDNEKLIADERLKIDQAAQEWQRNTNRANELLDHLVGGGALSNQVAVAVAGGLLHEKDQSALALLQALYTVSKSDDPAAKIASAFLPPITDSTSQDVTVAILESASKMAEDTNKEKYENITNMVHTLQMISQHSFDDSIRQKALEISKSIAPKLALALSENKQSPDVKAAVIADFQPTLNAFVTSKDSNPKETEEKKLAQQLLKTIKARVYILVPEEDQRVPVDKELAESLGKDGFAIPSVGVSKSISSDAATIYYYSKEDFSEATRLATSLKDGFGIDVSVTKGVPTGRERSRHYDLELGEDAVESLTSP
ncbi:MAG: hypothetical protein QM796_01535 [Chthoniobacteraceae bacterium]